MKRLIGAAVAAAALSLVGAPAASAYTEGEADFLSRLHTDGFQDVFKYPLIWIDSGYWTCNRLNYANGTVVAAELTAASPYNTYEQEVLFMADAVTALCPWHDHTNEYVPPQLKYAV